MSRELEAEIDRLYQLPLESFTTERNALAARLRPGDRDAAARVRALGKPSATAWAVNQVFWKARETLDALRDASDRLRALQQAGATPNELREAMRERREALAAAVRAAERALSGGRSVVHAATTRKLVDTLEALATLGAARPSDVQPGRLTADLAPTGFAALAELSPAAPLAERIAAAEPGAGPAQAGAAEDAHDRAERARLEYERTARERRMQAACTAAEEAERRAEGARGELAEAQRRLASAVERASRATAAAQEARAVAERAERELAEASQSSSPSANHSPRSRSRKIR